MLFDLIELLLDGAGKRRGWTWQRYLITPIITMAIVLILLCFAFATSSWWIPALLAPSS